MPKRTTLFSGLFFLLALCFARPAGATDFLPVTLAEGVDRADAVVVATVQHDRQGEGGGSLVVEQVLKGPADLKRIEMPFLGVKMDPAIADGARGVFLVVRNPTDQTWHFFHPVSIYLTDNPAERIQTVRRVQAMLDDPAPMLRELEAGQALTPDLCFAVGRKLQALRISSPQADGLDERVLGYDPESSIASEIPWAIRERLTVQVRYDEKAEVPLRVTTDQADSLLLPAFRERLEQASRWRFVQPMLRDQMQVTIDTRQPERVGGMEAPQALGILRGAVSPELGYEEARELLRALAWARDLDAIGPVAKLLDAEQGYLAEMAATWLGKTGSAQASAALIDYLDRAELPSREYDSVVAAASRSLYQIGDPAAMPAFRKLARLNVGFGAYALGRYGEKDDFALLLAVGNAAPKDSSAVQTALLWLVKRSNLPIEDWMISPTWTGEIGQQKQPMWRAWWQTHREGFEVQRSYEEAFGNN